MKQPKHSIFVSCAKGSEHALAEEIRRLGGADIKPTFGGVFTSHKNPLFYYELNLHLRTGFRVFIPIESFKANSPEELYANAKQLRWDRLFDRTQTFAVSAHVRNSNITHSHYAGLKLKDAIADWFRDRFGERPNVDTYNPNISFHLLIDRNKATLSFDTSGRSLHRRGYRTQKTAAPLMETLASTMIYLSGWDGKTPFYDLMCGSGTLGIEAALLANNTPPGLLNDEFSFQHFSNYNDAEFRRLLDEAEEYEQIENLTPIFVNDLSGEAVAIAKANAKRAGVLEQCRYTSKNVLDFRPVSKRGIVILNPPYGERIGDERQLAGFYNRLEQVVKNHYKGLRLCILAPKDMLRQNFRMKPDSVHTLYNAKIECEFSVFDIYR